MGIHIEVNSETENEMEKVFTFTIMEISTKENGSTTLRMDKENIHIIPVENGTKVNGKTTKKMDKENTYSIMVINIWANFKME